MSRLRKIKHSFDESNNVESEQVQLLNLFTSHVHSVYRVAIFIMGMPIQNQWMQGQNIDQIFSRRAENQRIYICVLLNAVQVN